MTLSNNSIILCQGYITEELCKNIRIHEEKPTVIGDDTWIASGAIILPGVELSGKHIVVGAGAVVTKSVYEDNVVLGGNPAKIVKYLSR